ncbi:hypothetical protein IVB12_06300 [Bradyrhizobium sp. 179]|uniref:hypothetical protein n=1 Tax=Bradyrhizobium sp. 179 TaxID=2782648 RepID=UPI001FFBE554|nr:hypothetical protein [Bradyrhizobium sp. 179]MCK1541600.1 hypothetical protein [Bradyrhizobium sp. 179]
MSEVTYYVALPFVFSDDGVAAGEAAECLSANAAVNSMSETFADSLRNFRGLDEAPGAFKRFHCGNLIVGGRRPASRR